MTADTQRVTLPPLKHLLKDVYYGHQDRDGCLAVQSQSETEAMWLPPCQDRRDLASGKRSIQDASPATVVCNSSSWCTSTLSPRTYCCSCPSLEAPHTEYLPLQPTDDCGCVDVCPKQTHRRSYSSASTLNYGSPSSSSSSAAPAVRRERTRVRAHTATGYPPTRYSPLPSPPHSPHVRQHIVDDTPRHATSVYMQPQPQQRHRYHCMYCSKTFSRPSSLRIHMYSHTGEKPHSCPYPRCGRRFSVQSNMRRHLRVHDGAPGDTGGQVPDHPPQRMRFGSQPCQPATLNGGCSYPLSSSSLSCFHGFP